MMTEPVVEHVDEDDDVKHISASNEQKLWQYSTVMYIPQSGASSELEFGQHNSRADDVRIIAQSISRAAAKLEERYTNAVVVNMTHYFTPSISARDVYSSFVTYLNEAVAAVHFDDQVAFVVRVGRSLIAQCKESSQLIKTYFSRYAQSRFGYRLKADTVRGYVVRKNQIYGVYWYRC